MDNVCSFHRIKHLKSGTWDKGIEIKDQFPTFNANFEAAKQSYHAYLGAYAYGHNNDTDYVACFITNMLGTRLMWEVWNNIQTPEPEPEPEPEDEPEG